MKYTTAAVAALLSCCLFGATALAQNKAVKIGVLDDMSGPYAENTGPGDVASVKFAIADFGGSVLGKPIELVTADFQSKVDVGVGIARRWYDDENVDMILGIPEFGAGARAGESGRGKEPHRHADRGGDLGADRQVLQLAQHPLDLRHLRPGQDDRQCAEQAGRRYLVLHHRGLRLRPGGGSGCHQLHQGGGRQGAGLGASSAEHAGLLLLRRCRRRPRRPRG